MWSVAGFGNTFNCMDASTTLFVIDLTNSGYHRDFQLLKEPLLRGVGRTLEMLDMLTLAIPKLSVDKARCLSAVSDNLLVTDEVIRRVEAGEPFRSAYRAVAQEIKAQTIHIPAPDPTDLIRRRRSTGGIGNLGLPKLHSRLHKLGRQQHAARTRFADALTTLRAPIREATS